jgi:hypothetical protein
MSRGAIRRLPWRWFGELIVYNELRVRAVKHGADGTP